MSVTNADLSHKLPNLAEKNLYLAPQDVFGTHDLTESRSLHFTNFTQNRTQGLESQDEFGGNASGATPNVDPAAPTGGDIEASGTIEAIFDLEEIVYWFNYLMGEPVTTGGASPYTHTYSSGKAQLPIFSARLEQSNVQQVNVKSGLMKSLSLPFSNAAGYSIASLGFIAQDIITAANTTPHTGFINVVSETLRRKLVNRKWILRIDDVAYDYWLSGQLTYDNGATGERYIKAGNELHSMFIAEPSLSGNFALRQHEGLEAGIAGLLDPSVQHKVEFEGVSSVTNQKAIITLPKCNLTRNDSQDGRLGQTTFNFQASRDGSAPAMTSQIINRLATVV